MRLISRRRLKNENVCQLPKYFEKLQFAKFRYAARSFLAGCAGSMQWVLQDARCRWHQVRSPFSQLTVLLHGIHARSRHCMSSLQGVTGQIYPCQYYFRCHHEVSHYERSQISCICSTPELGNIITCHIAQSSGEYPSWVHNTFHLKSLKIIIEN